jgi:hypothetical protein
VLAVVVLVGLAMTFITATSGLAAEPDTKKAAVAALRRYADMTNKRQWGRIYKMLYPGQQALLSSAQFVSCSKHRPELTISIDKIDDVRYEYQNIPRTNDSVRTVAITVDATARFGSKSLKNTSTENLIYADGKWRFALTEPNLENCNAARVPTGVPTTPPR